MALSSQTVALKQNLMFLGYLQVWFYARHPNSQLSLGKPGNKFGQARGAINQLIS